MKLDDQIAELAHLLEQSEKTIAITGAGISMGSGIKDMEHMNVAQVMQTSLPALVQLHPERSYRLLRKSFLTGMFETGPSLAHRKIAELETKGRIQGVITTNIDHLHSLAGSRSVAEIQGSYGINRCAGCRKHDDNVQIWNRGRAPRCQNCNGVMLAFPVYTRVGRSKHASSIAARWVSEAELVLAIGSKGMYGSYLSYLNPQAKIVQVNPKPTQFDDLAFMTIRAQADAVFSCL